MITLSSGGMLCQHARELPDLWNSEELFLDVETTSGDPDVPAFNPWKGHRILGVSVATKDSPVYYVPVRHQDGHNVPLELFQRWLHDVVATARRWVNHNVKFDAHFCAADGAEFTGRLTCTLARARLLDNNRWGDEPYGLTSLVKDYLGWDIEPYEMAIKPYLRNGRKKNADYAAIPHDICGDYACVDVMATRALFYEQEEKRPNERVWEQEELLTPVLYDMEKEGIRVDPSFLKIESMKLIYKMLQLEEQIHKSIGRSFLPTSNDDCYDLLCNMNGLPVVGWTDKMEPSFDAKTLKEYLTLDEVKANAELSGIIGKITEYRETSVLNGMFVERYLADHVDGIVHCNYNQNVRTGRMSCRNPNMQQLSEEAKAYVIPKDGEAFLSSDYSQIEFRGMVHYMKDGPAIEAYRRDPFTDFHTWVAEMCGIPRKPAKNINFAIGYGGGKKKIVTMLSLSSELTEQLAASLGQEASHDRITALRVQRGEEVYQRYHDTLPNLRVVSRAAERTVKSRGFVYNLHGRYLRADPQKAYKAFNSIIQSEAADFVKERVIALSPRYNDDARMAGLKLLANVHDEVLTAGPKEVIYDPNTVPWLHSILESDEQTKYLVPIKVKSGRSSENWAKAKSDGDGAVPCP